MVECFNNLANAMHGMIQEAWELVNAEQQKQTVILP
jgi:hypothetical protein